MSAWYQRTAESDALLAEERVVLGATELIADAMQRRGTTQNELARRIGVSPSEISQRLSGRRNMSLRKFAAMLHALGFGVEGRLVDRQTVGTPVTLKHTESLMPTKSPITYTRTGVPITIIDGRRAS